ncbi:MAG: SurA N-terminal domain-containing protein [Chloroflexi bacterium]|nr:SurA N-terminal domain-containing protein [Chloroflexota bacterium]
MPEVDPYTLLQVPDDATEDEIEDAYDVLFDRYEPQAQAGSVDAINALDQLNNARALLVDPQRRAALDRQLGIARKKAGSGSDIVSGVNPLTSTAAATVEAKQQTLGEPAQVEAVQTVTRQGQPAEPSKRAVKQPSPSSTVKARRRSAARPRAVVVERRRLPVMPFLLGALLLFVLALVVTFFIAKNGGQAGAESRGEIVATVNGAPIYMQDYQERLARDKANIAQDPLFAPLINNFQGITGTRMLQIVSSDSLDKLINLEVIQQQAKKEGLYPTDAQQQGLIQQARGKDLASGTSFTTFLKEKNISEGQYDRAVVANVVYTVMADKHMPKTGTDQERTDAFIKWICTTRQSYDVKVNLTFTAKNDPCTSGLPSDVPLPGLGTPTAPEPLGTAVPATVAPQPGSAGTPTTP